MYRHEIDNYIRLLYIFASWTFLNKYHHIITEENFCIPNANNQQWVVGLINN
jgi:hypothetical protein